MFSMPLLQCLVSDLRAAPGIASRPESQAASKTPERRDKLASRNLAFFPDDSCVLLMTSLELYNPGRYYRFTEPAPSSFQ